MDDRFPSHRLDKVALRLPAGMRKALQEAAGVEGRSMNAEIVMRLEQSLQGTRQEQVLMEAFVRRDEVISELVARLETLDPKFAASRKQMNTLAEEYWAKTGRKKSTRK